MAKSWYYVDADDQEVGPVNGRVIRARVADGTITRKTQVWRDDLPDWVEAGRIRKLFEKPSSSSKKSVSTKGDAEKAGGEKRVARRPLDLRGGEDEWDALADGEQVPDDDPFAFLDESGQVLRSFARPEPKKYNDEVDEVDEDDEA